MFLEIKKSRLLLALFPLALVFAANKLSAKTPITCGMTITAPGKYFLNGDLTCSAPAVQVGADDVHINLRGHALSGFGVGAGIITAAGPTCVAVSRLHVNGGTIQGFGTAISLCAPLGSRGTKSHVNGMTLTGNIDGISCFDYDNNHINGNIISGNQQNGVEMFDCDNNRFNTNQVTNNGIVGFVLAAGSAGIPEGNVINSNSISNNGAIGVAVISGSRNVLRGNMVNQNFGTGIILFAGALDNTVVGSTALGNGLDLSDLNLHCDDNAWKDNTFETSNQPCIQ